MASMWTGLFTSASGCHFNRLSLLVVTVSLSSRCRSLPAVTAQLTRAVRLSRCALPSSLRSSTDCLYREANSRRHTRCVGVLLQCRSLSMFTSSNSKPSDTSQPISAVNQAEKVSQALTSDRASETSQNSAPVSRVVQQRPRTDLVLTVPNLLTLSRMLLAPVLGYLVLSESYMLACIVFTVAGATDLLDGLIARNFVNQTSSLGSFIDPLADKLLISVLYITLTYVHHLPLLLTTLVIARDVCLVSAGCYVRYTSLPAPRMLGQCFDFKNNSAKIQPLAVSKINTAVQLSLVAGTLAAAAFDFVDHPALHALWYVTAMTTIMSGVGYMFARDTFKLLKQPRPEQ